MATKEHKKQVRGLIEALESRIHAGPPIQNNEILSAREFLRQNDFSPASDYYSRLLQIETRLVTRMRQPAYLPGKRNYGGEAAGCWMQVQSAYDHVILSTCYSGEFDMRRGKIKISHRFNEAGRIDFVELKFIRSMQPLLNGEIRKLVLIKDYAHTHKEWHAAEAFILPILPQELIFLYQDIFRCPRDQVLSWLINFGHRIASDLLDDLHGRYGVRSSGALENDQLCLEALPNDEVAWPILTRAAALECATDLINGKTAIVRYVRKEM